MAAGERSGTHLLVAIRGESPTEGKDLDDHAHEQGLDQLHLSPKEQAQLSAMGINTLEQLAQSSRYDLGIGKAKGDSLVTRAQNILAVEHARNVSVQDGSVEVELDAASPGVLAAVKGVLGAYDQPALANCVVELSGSSLRFRALPSRPPQPCSHYDAAKAAMCSSASVDRCACHGHYLCRVHLEGHVPSIAQEFGRVAGEAGKLDERLRQRKQRELAEAGVTLPVGQVQAFARERGFTGFWQTVFEGIHCQEVMKQALAASVFSPPNDPVHVLVVGAPASAKSLAREILLRNFTGLTPVGGNATRAGLVCNLSTGELGALAFSNGKTVLVDEFDKIHPEDLRYCLELLSNGRCDVHSARVHETLESHFTMMAFANPEGDVFSGDLQADVGVRPTVMSRFALVVKVEAISGEDLTNLFRRSLEGKRELQRLPEYYDQWVKLAHAYEPAWKVTTEAREEYLRGVTRIVEKYISTPLRRDVRMGDYLRRVPAAMARAEFGTVEDRHLEQALRLFESSLATWA